MNPLGIGGRPLSVLTREQITAEREAYKANPEAYKIYARAKELGVRVGTLRYHLKPSPCQISPRRPKPREISQRVLSLIYAGDMLERALTGLNHSERTAWHQAKKAFGK